MKNLQKTLLGVVTVSLSVLQTVQAGSRPVKIIQQWSGRVADHTLMKQGPRLITTAPVLAKLWKSWSIEGAVPRVDFAKQIVICSSTRGTHLNLRPALDDKGDLSLGGIVSHDIRPGFRYVIATISREGIKSVEGVKLKKINNRRRPSRKR